MPNPVDPGPPWQPPRHRVAVDPRPQSGIRWQNERRVFQLIRRHGSIVRTALQAQTGLSAQAISVIVRRLHDMGLVEEDPPQAAARSVGKPPHRIRINPEGALAAGCNIERDRVDLAIVDLVGRVRRRLTLPISSESGPSRVLQAIAQRLTEWIAADPLGSRTIGVGVGVPGPIDLQRGTITHPPYFPGWEEVPVLEALASLIARPVIVDNCATAAAVGEAWVLRQAHPTFLYCHWGIGIGGGLILDSELYPGTTGNVIELGHVVVNPLGTPCYCGSVGCLEAEASWGALMRLGQNWGIAPAAWDDLPAAQARCAWLTPWLHRAAQYMGQAITSVINIVDVDHVIVGGHYFDQVKPWFLPVIQQWLDDKAFRRRIRPISVTGSNLGEAAGATGAATLVFQRQLPPYETAR